MTVRRPRGVVLAGVVVTVALMLGACGGSKATKSSERPLTSEEASTLADALYLNWQDQGATFTANAAWTSIGRTIAMQGEVDWRTGTGHALVRAMGADTGLSEVWWNGTVVVERWPAIGTILGGLGYTNAKYLSRAPDPEKRLVDHVIAVVSGLAAPQRENPLLIQQTPGSAFVRHDDLRGSSIDVLRYGERSLYWIAVDTSRMLRFDGNASSGTAPTVVDLLTTGPQTITPPPRDTIIPTSSIASVYRGLTGG